MYSSITMLNSYYSTLTSKGQATIPAPIRKTMGIKPGEKLVFQDNGQVVTVKTHSQLVHELAGSLKPKVKVKYSDRKADKAVEQFVVREYLKYHGKTP